MTGITYQDLRQLRVKRDEYLRDIEIGLQGAAARLVSEYINSLKLPKGSPHSRRQLTPEDFVQIGLYDENNYVEWSNSYSMLEMDDDEKLTFPLRTLLGDDGELDTDEIIIVCTLYFDGDYLYIELQDEDENRLENFKFPKDIGQEELRPVTHKIKKIIASTLKDYQPEE